MAIGTATLHRSGIRVLALTGAAAALACAMWTALVGFDALTDADRGVARWAAGTDSRALDRLAAAGSLLFGVVGILLLALAVGVVLGSRRQWYRVAALLLALLASALAERGIRAVFVQPTAPEVRTTSFGRAEHDTPLPAAAAPRASLPALGVPDARHSYPSGHTTLTAALLVSAGLGLFALRRTAIVPAMLLVLLAGWSVWSEIHRGTHVLSDAIGGLLLGTAVALLGLVLLHAVAGVASTD